MTLDYYHGILVWSLVYTNATKRMYMYMNISFSIFINIRDNYMEICSYLFHPFSCQEGLIEHAR